MEALSASVLHVFELLPNVKSVIDEHNAKRERGVYVIEMSTDEAEKVMERVERDKNASALVKCIRFYKVDSERVRTIEKSLDDGVFADAMHTHKAATTLVLVVWLYAGGNATEKVREREDFGVVWGVLTM